MPDRRTPQNNSDHDLLIRVDQKVESLTQKVDTVINNQDKRLEELEKDHVTQEDYGDHEKRLRFVERYVWGAIAIIGLINLVGFALIITVFKNH